MNIGWPSAKSPRQSLPRRGDGYRPDVDALRAVAVVPVVLFHAGIPGFGGGYVGVDVFFVISGFLITGIIAREITEGRFSIVEFYRRRARRIFPALTAVVLTTLAAGWLILTPSEYVDLAKSAGSIAIFASNFYFWKSVSYFDPGIQPLLHTWSLAVEEQYYLFFPLLLYALSGRRSWMLGALVGIFVLSLCFSVALVAWKPGAAFYLLPSRAWELMLGGLLALQIVGPPPSQRIARAASLSGLGLIAAAVIFYTAATPFPGVAALPPSLGAALVIWSRDDLIAHPSVVAIGLASYSYYLWHLPIIEFAKYLSGGHLSVAVGLAASTISLLLAFISLEFIEKPFRVIRTKQHGSRLAWVAAAGMPFLVGASASVIYTSGNPSRFPPERLAQLAIANDRNLHPQECMSLDDRWIPISQACRLGAPVEPTALLWGDSHAMVTATALRTAAERTESSFLFVANADCPIGIGFEIDERFEPGLTKQANYRRCGEYNRLMLELAVQSPQVKTVVLSSRWTNWRIGEPANPAENPVDVRLRDSEGVASSVAANREKFERGFAELIQRLTSADKRVVIVGPLPEPSYNVPHRLHVSHYGFVSVPSPIRVSDFEARHASILKFLKQFDGMKGVQVVWPASYLCDRGRCPTVRAGKPLYFDHNHLSVESAQDIAPAFEPILAASRT